MSPGLRRTCLVSAAFFLCAAVLSEPGAVGPIGVGAGSHTLVDSAGSPFFWLGNTQWTIHRDYTIAEARRTLQNVAAKGFTVVVTMLAGWGDGTTPNIHGDRVWLNTDPSTPNQAYFTPVDSVVHYANELGLCVRIGMLHNQQLQYMGQGRGRAYARWVAQRYKDSPNVIFSLHGNVDNPDLIAMVREMAAGIEEGDGGRHPISQKPDPSPKSSGIIQDEPWLDYTQSQTWNRVDLIYPMVSQDYARTPVKPTVMDEGAYEAGEEYGFEVTPLLIRRQAYYTCLAGGFHTYGHNDSWRRRSTWEQSLDAPGAFHMGVCKDVFLSLYEWWSLVPDQSVFTSGGDTDGNVLNLAARHNDGKWVLAYLGTSATVTLDMNTIAAGNADAFWIDPATGDTTVVGSFPASGTRSFTTPGGREDALLVLAAHDVTSTSSRPDRRGSSWGKSQVSRFVIDDGRQFSTDEVYNVRGMKLSRAVGVDDRRQQYRGVFLTVDRRATTEGGERDRCQ